MVSIFLSIIPFVFVLTTLVFIHELGHYWVARRNGVHVEAFSIGFGPELFGWTDASGTRWRISLLPLGGYVRMLSDENEASTPSAEALANLSEEMREKTLHFKTPWQKIKVAAAGPLANYIFAVFLFWVLMLAVGERFPSTDPVVGRVVPDSPAASATLAPGDKIVRINDKSISSFIDIFREIREHPDEKVTINFVRSGEPQQVQASLASVTVKMADGKKQVGVLGIEPKDKLISHTFLSAGGAAFTKVAVLTKASFQAIGQIIFGVRPTTDLVGPLGIAKRVAELAHSDILSVIWAMAILSVSLGFINILPIPLLDGGQVMMYIGEWIYGEPFSERIQMIVGYLGLIIVGGLFLISTSNDIMRFWK